ncbi:hypothetical protein GALMADRAFT_1340475 [Galerina marginata CBS 339.88]|uniref:NACHT domain-containing protein n=1 Tax=Galerina marginata (strain CBS 339.88) TaxID=685588 RepID=A0A067TPI6_GALM3|nr:hypothetical protein GALMADRAFT_1340475 [Galerina marginata CBS 339.88]
MYNNSNVLVSGGTSNYIAGDFVQTNRRGFETLEKYVTPGALHNSGEVSEQPKCHPGTRVAILEYLEAWGRALTYIYPIVWLHGPAGSGKSAILRTIAQIFFEQGLLLASFFFFRSATGRNSSDHFIATISYQLALSIPLTRPYIEEAMERNPLIFSLSLWDQAQALVLSPILAVRRDNPSLDFSQFPRVIIIDGLDECSDPDKQSRILQVLCRILENLPIPLAVLIASRPEPHIRREFNVPGRLNELSSSLSLDNSYNPDADIKKYLEEMFAKVEQEHSPYLPSSPWPPPEVIDKLVAKASGQFIYVSTVVKFVSSPRHNPAKRLDIILGMIDAGNLKPFEQLDMLYSTIFLNITESDPADVFRILGLLLAPYEDGFLKRGRTPGFLERLLNLETGYIRRLLYDLESLLTMDGGDDRPVRFFHASLSDYLFDSSRSGQFCIDLGMVYADLAEHCTGHLSKPTDWTGAYSLLSPYSTLIISNAPHL